MYKQIKAAKLIAGSITFKGTQIFQNNFILLENVLTLNEQ